VGVFSEHSVCGSLIVIVFIVFYYILAYFIIYFTA